jgi:hypothetical protein
MNNSLRLFDDIKRDYEGPSGYGESRYLFLNRTARPQFKYVRDLLQTWFDGYTAETKDINKGREICNLFKSESDKEHLSAFFELYLFQLVIQMGFEVDIEPEWDGGRPDFLLTAPNGDHVLLEATCSFPDRIYGDAQSIENRLLDEINKRVNSPNFFLSIKINSEPDGNASYGKMCRFLEQELSKLDPDKIARKQKEGGEIATIKWLNGTCDIEFQPIPKNKMRGRPDVRPIGIIGPNGVTSISPEKNIRSGIKRKCGKYDGEKAQSIPYILALNTLDNYMRGVHNS